MKNELRFTVEWNAKYKVGFIT